jgi:hypothetical protein
MVQKIVASRLWATPDAATTFDPASLCAGYWVRMMPIGAEFVGITRDLSNGGLCVIHSATIDDCHGYVAVELADTDGRFLQAALEILRMGPSRPFREITVRFVTKVRRYEPFVSRN